MPHACQCLSSLFFGFKRRGGGEEDRQLGGRRKPGLSQPPHPTHPPTLTLQVPFLLGCVAHKTQGIDAITPAYLKPPKCVEQVAHNALLLLFGLRSQDGRFRNAFKWHITGRSLAGLPRTISPGAKEEQQAAGPYLSVQRDRGRRMSPDEHGGIVKITFSNCRVCLLNPNKLLSGRKTVNIPAHHCRLEARANTRQVEPAARM